MICGPRFSGYSSLINSAHVYMACTSHLLQVRFSHPQPLHSRPGNFSFTLKLLLVSQQVQRKGVEAIIYSLPETNSSPLKIGKNAQKGSREGGWSSNHFCAHSITNPINKTPGSRFITPLTHLFSAIYQGCNSIHQLSPLGLNQGKVD